MNRLYNIDKLGTVILQNQFTILKAIGHIDESISYNQWIVTQQIFAEAPIEVNIKEIVFDYYKRQPFNEKELSTFKNFEDLLNEQSKKTQIVIVKQVSIYFYQKVFNDGPQKIFSLEKIAILHNTTKQGVDKAIKSVQDNIDTNKYTEHQIDEITEQINKHINNNTLKYA